MIATDEDSLICDLAETYQILNYRELPLELVATLSFGLRDNSRIKLKMANQKVDAQTLLQASTVDALNTLVWFKTEGARNGEGRPKSIVNSLIGDVQFDSDVLKFTSAEEFEAARLEILNGEEVSNGNSIR